MFSVTAEGVTIYEASNGFYITDGIVTRGIGDGVDLFDNVAVGSRRFYRLLAASLKLGLSEYIEAYGLFEGREGQKAIDDAKERESYVSHMKAGYAALKQKLAE